VLEAGLVGCHDAEGVAALFLGVGFFELDEVALADVAGMCVVQPAAEQLQREGVALDLFHRGLEFPRRAFDVERGQQVRAGLRAQSLQFMLRRRALPKRFQIRHRIPRGHQTQPPALLR